MSQKCDRCGKGPMAGNNVSHSKVRTRRRFMPNLQSTRVLEGSRLGQDHPLHPLHPHREQAGL